MFSTENPPLAPVTHLTLVSDGTIHHDGRAIGAMTRQWRSLPGLHGGYEAEGFAVLDPDGNPRAWTLHRGDALQLAYTLPVPHHARHASTPLFRVGEAVATGFGAGIVTGFYRRENNAGRAHWRYAIQMESGGAVDAAQSGVHATKCVFPRNSS